MARPLPVILTTNATTPVRVGMLLTALAAWRMLVEAGVCTVHLIEVGPIRSDGLRVQAVRAMADLLTFTTRTAHGRLIEARPGDQVGVPEGSLRTRHVLAAEIQRTLDAPWAVWVDDDIVVPPNPLWLPFALDCLALPRPMPWGLVGAWLPHASPPNWPPPHLPRPIASVGSVGGLRFVRAGCPVAFPPYVITDARRGYDPALCKAVRDGGFDVGVFTHPAVQAVHVGAYHSAVHPCDLVPGQAVPR